MRIEVRQSTCDPRFEPACKACVVCHAVVNEAGNRRYDSSIQWGFAELSSGHFALYDHRGRTVLITDEWAEVLKFYQARPPYIATPRPPREFAATRSRGKLSAEEKKANTAALLAKLKGNAGA